MGRAIRVSRATLGRPLIADGRIPIQAILASVEADLVGATTEGD